MIQDTGRVRAILQALRHTCRAPRPLSSFVLDSVQVRRYPQQATVSEAFVQSVGELSMDGQPLFKRSLVDLAHPRRPVTTGRHSPEPQAGEKVRLRLADHIGADLIQAVHRLT